jgi:hypothetical protein
MENYFDSFGVEMGEEEARRCRLDGGKEGGDLALRFSFDPVWEGEGRRCMARRSPERMAVVLLDGGQDDPRWAGLGRRPLGLGPGRMGQIDNGLWENLFKFSNKDLD